MTQTEQVLRYMKENGGITQAEAVQEIGCYRLSARIADLKAEGIKIGKDTITIKNRYGETVHFANYKLEEDA